MSRDLHAMIFSGGGADGAYQVGVAKALFNGKSPATGRTALDPDVFTGTSIGSFNASFLVSQWEERGASAVADLEDAWVDGMAWQGTSNGGFRVRMNPLELLDPREYLKEPLRFRPLTNLATDLAKLTWEAVNRGYHLFASDDEPLLGRLADFFNLSSFVAAEPWEKTIRESIDFKKIRESKKKLRIAATNWAFGEVREFRNTDMTDKLGPAAVRASSAVPGVYPPAHVGAQTYVDGAVLMNTPLSPAIKALREVQDEADDAEIGDDSHFVVHVIYMNTDVERMPVAALESTLQTLYRQQVISWAAAVNRDIELTQALNQGLELLRSDRGELTAGLADKDAVQHVIRSADRLLEAVKKGKRYKQVTVHRYFPPDGLDGALGFLDVRAERMKRLFDEGFNNTVHHDCEANHCVLVDRGEKAA